VPKKTPRKVETKPAIEPRRNGDGVVTSTGSLRNPGRAMPVEQSYADNPRTLEDEDLRPDAPQAAPEDSEKPNHQPLGFFDWVEHKDFQPVGTEDNRGEKLREALAEFTEFVKWNGTIEDLLNELREPRNRESRTPLEIVCSELRRNISEKLQTDVPAKSRKRVQRCARSMAEALAVLTEDWQVAVAVMLHFKSPEEFTNALSISVELLRALRLAEQDLLSEHVETKIFGISSSNPPVLMFLYRCRDLMMAYGRRKVPLVKGDCALLRFARPLYTYATGWKVPKDGSFDRQIDELRHIKPTVAIQANALGVLGTKRAPKMRFLS
jgi:hypothetical protein